MITFHPWSRAAVPGLDAVQRIKQKPPVGPSPQAGMRAFLSASPLSCHSDCAAPKRGRSRTGIVTRTCSLSHTVVICELGLLNHVGGGNCDGRQPRWQDEHALRGRHPSPVRSAANARTSAAIAGEAQPSECIPLGNQRKPRRTIAPVFVGSLRTQQPLMSVWHATDSTAAC